MNLRQLLSSLPLIESQYHFEVDLQKDHVNEIERAVRTVKGDFRKLNYYSPFQIACKLLIDLGVHFVVRQRTLIVPKDSYHGYSPRELTRGIVTDYIRDYQASWGDGIVARPTTGETSNTMNSRAGIYIFVGYKDNHSAEVKLLNPSTMHIVERKISQQDIQPLPQYVIDAINKHQNRSSSDDNLDLDFEFRLGNGVLIEDDIHMWHERHHPNSTNAAAPTTPVLQPTAMSSPGDFEHGVVQQDGDPVLPDATVVPPPQLPSAIAPSADHVEDIEPGLPEPEPPPGNSSKPLPNSRRSARIDSLANLKPPRKNSTFYMTIQKALKTYKERGYQAMYDELKQIVDLQVFKPVHLRHLSDAEVLHIITCHIIFKEKYDTGGNFIKLKARLVAGGHQQDRDLYENVSSPTVSTQSVYMIATLAATEKRSVFTADFTGAFLKGKYLEEDNLPIVTMKLSKIITESLLKVSPTWSEYVNPGDGCIYVTLMKPLYGLVEAAQLWYKSLSSALMEFGFIVNPYDKCVFNKTIDGKQTTICIHVDDLFITSQNRECVDALFVYLQNKFGDLTFHNGPVFDFLGINFDFDTPGKVHLRMSSYIKELLESCGISHSAKTPALEDLFDIDSDAPNLDSYKAKQFHTLVAQLLYLSKRVRPDILTAVNFLCTRVKSPSMQDSVKLERILCYLYGSQNLCLTLEGGNLHNIYAYVDASYGVHKDAKSQSGMVIRLGKASVSWSSTKQKNNSKSSTESELYSLSDSCGPVIWARNFLIAQGYKVGPATIYQDNKSTIQLAKNGLSSSQRTRHINIRYFFVKDRIESKEIDVVYMNTDEMIADMLTKPLQGSKFILMRRRLLNIDYA